MELTGDMAVPVYICMVLAVIPAQLTLQMIYTRPKLCVYYHHDIRIA